MSRDIVPYVIFNDKILKIYDDEGNDRTAYIWDNTPMPLFFGESPLGYNENTALAYNRGLPENTPEEILKDWDSRDCTYFDYCELVAWNLTPNVHLIDWWKMEEDEKDWENIPPEDYPRYNALEGFMNKVNMIFSIYGIYNPRPGEVTIIIGLSY